MSALLVVAIGLVGGIGSLARFLLDGAVSLRADGAFPFGTLVVNVLGAFLLGCVSAAGLSADVERLIATGAVGGFTTFSTWVLESHRLAEDGRAGLSATNFTVSVALGIAVVWAGRELGGVL